MAPKLILMGTGVRDLSHMTAETIRAIGSCRVLFSLHADPSVNAALAGMCPIVVDLTVLYRDRRLDLEVYRGIVDTVVDRLRGERTVGVIFHGHPLLYSNPAQMLLRHCEKSGIACEVLTGVSSLDAIFTALKLDAGSSGLQVFDVNRLVLYRLSPDPRTPCLLFQIGSFGSALISRGLDNAPGRFRALEAYLKRFYAPDHPADIVECSTLTGQPDSVLRTTIGRLDESGGRINYNSTLYIPAARTPEPDPAFLARLLGEAEFGELVSKEPRHDD